MHFAQELTPILSRPAQNIQRLPVGRETVTKAWSGDGAAGDPCQVRPLRSARVENKQGSAHRIARDAVSNASHALGLIKRNGELSYLVTAFHIGSNYFLLHPHFLLLMLSRFLLFPPPRCAEPSKPSQSQAPECTMATISHPGRVLC